MEGRDSYVFYRSFYEGIKTLPQGSGYAVFMAICEYVFEGKEPGNLQGVECGFFSMIRPQIDSNIKKYENGKKGGRPKSQTGGFTDKKSVVIETETSGFRNEKPNVNVNDNANDNDNVNAKGGLGGKIPPTVDEVRAYCAERGNKVNAERFVDFYMSKNWMVGKNKMSNWKAAVRNWEKQDADKGASAQKSRFSNFQQREYDYDQLEAKEQEWIKRKLEAEE